MADDEIERLRSVLARAEDEGLTPLRRLIRRIGTPLRLRIQKNAIGRLQPPPRPRKKDAA